MKSFHLKSEWLDRKLLVNLAVFHSDYTDLQTTINVQSASGNFISLVRNAAEARSRGVELEGHWTIAGNFRLSADVTYLDARYVHFENVNLTVLQSYCRSRLPPISSTPDAGCAQFFPTELYPDGIPQFRDRSGDRIDAPKWSGNVAARYSAALPGDYRLTTELSVPFASDYTRDQLDRWTGANERLDARLTLEPADGRWAIDVIGKNLTDEQILAFYGNLAQSPGTIQWQAQQPRNVAAQFRYNW